MTHCKTPARRIITQLAVSALLLTTTWTSQAFYFGEQTGWTFSNERIRGNEFKDYQNESGHHPLFPGIYLSVGGDRAFTGAALAAEASITITGIFRFDTDPFVLQFGDQLFQALHSSNSPEYFLKQALRPLNLLSRLKHTILHSMALNHTIGWRTLYTDETLFQQLKKMTSLPSKNFKLNLNNHHSWKQLIKHLEESNDHIAVLDISNLLQGYVTPRQLESFLKTLHPFMKEDTLVRETLFFYHLVGHYETRVQTARFFQQSIYKSSTLDFPMHKSSTLFPL